jgi:hypothetical protein
MPRFASIHTRALPTELREELGRTVAERLATLP